MTKGKNLINELIEVLQKTRGAWQRGVEMGTDEQRNLFKLINKVINKAKTPSRKSIKFAIGGGMVTDLPNIENVKHKMLKAIDGTIWLVAIQPNEADDIYVDGGFNSRGFGGRILSFDLEDGTTIDLHGPWHSNADSLFDATGYDIRNKYLTQGIIALKKKFNDKEYGRDIYSEILHYDEKAMIGEYNRIEKLAQYFADNLNKEVYFAVSSTGGGHGGMKKPGEKE